MRGSMSRILATIKCPNGEVEYITEQLGALGVNHITLEIVPYEKFVEESRMNYDCVFEQAWQAKEEVTYINFSFEDSDKGREACFFVEYNLKQIPLNLRYEME